MIRAKGDTVPRRVSAEYAAGLVKDGDWVDYGINTAQPDRFDRALAARKDQLRDVRIRRCARAPAWRGGFLAVMWHPAIPDSKFRHLLSGNVPGSAIPAMPPVEFPAFLDRNGSLSGNY